MSPKPKVIAIIPARGGSKSVKDKNIRLVRGLPLLVYSIRHAISASLIDRVIVSTNNRRYAEIAREYGAEVPFLRPAKYAQDSSTDLEVFRHTLCWLADHEEYKPDLCVHLRPTYPIRRISDIDCAIKILIDNTSYDSLRSVALVTTTPFKMWFRTNEGLLKPVLTSQLNEAFNLPRQLLPTVYVQNGCIDIMWYKTIMVKNSMTGDKIYGYKMNHNYDVDSEADLRRIQLLLSRKMVDVNTQQSFCIDIDGIIATQMSPDEYGKAKPIERNIKTINQLYDQANTIVLYTARGSMTGRDWREITEKQLKEWGVKYNDLVFGKPAADYYIDDKSVNIEEFDNSNNKKEDKNE